MVGVSKMLPLLLLLGLLLGFPAYGSNSCSKISDSCMMVYDKGGVTAVLQSTECSDWITSTPNYNFNCLFSTVQGRRSHQEDRISCNLDLNMPFLAAVNEVDKEIKVGVVAVFDGHIGTQASEMASKLLLDYFHLHSMVGSYKVAGQQCSSGLLHLGRDESRRLHILKDALVRTIQEIDETFTVEASKHNLPAGSTAVVGILADGHILVANVGDSKALLCTETLHSRKYGTSVSRLSSTELTRDHTANIPKERRRIARHGGFFLAGHDDVPLLNGHFPMTRAIGDVPLKYYGIIPDPELTEWLQVKVNDTYLVLASDGIFEALSPQDVCDLLHDEPYEESLKTEYLPLSSSDLADLIVRKAFEGGSPDNLSVVLVPLKSFSKEPSLGVSSTVAS